MATDTGSPRSKLRHAVSNADISHPLSPAPSPPLSSSALPRSRSISPSPARLSCPQLYRSDFSDTSSASTLSTLSSQSNNARSVSGSSLSTSTASSRRRGYVRPQGATFADSAKNRESVMSLGSIAHLQYYFARTGLLDGKGAQARDVEIKKRRKQQLESNIDGVKENKKSSVLGEDYVDSPIDGELEDWEAEEMEMMLPPTVSTYAQRIPYVEPPPDAETLRRELLESLEKVSKALKEMRAHNQDEKINSRWSTPVQPTAQRSNTTPQASPGKRGGTSPSPARDQENGWHQISGMHMLDVSTLAIRAAREYYMQHDAPARLHQLKSERKIREDFLQVMDVLKRMAARNFSGGMREDEMVTLETWVHELGDMLVREKRIEAQEARDRKSWKWLAGSWPEERRRQREWEFMKTFLMDGESMPKWEPPEPGNVEKPSALLEGLRDGLILVTLHNRILKKSRKQFGEIKNFYTDTGKPYRAAENLRFWIKAAELRWEVKLQLDVMGVVHGIGEGIWEQFDRAVLDWCRAVREEITVEWKQGSVQVPPPIVVAEPEAAARSRD